MRRSAGGVPLLSKQLCPFELGLRRFGRVLLVLQNPTPENSGDNVILPCGLQARGGEQEQRTHRRREVAGSDELSRRAERVVPREQQERLADRRRTVRLEPRDESQRQCQLRRAFRSASEQRPRAL